jgi:hypothetical protein
VNDEGPSAPLGEFLGVARFPDKSGDFKRLTLRGEAAGNSDNPI